MLCFDHFILFCPIAARPRLNRRPGSNPHAGPSCQGPAKPSGAGRAKEISYATIWYRFCCDRLVLYCPSSGFAASVRSARGSYGGATGVQTWISRLPIRPSVSGCCWGAGAAASNGASIYVPVTDMPPSRSWACAAVAATTVRAQNMAVRIMFIGDPCLVPRACGPRCCTIAIDQPCSSGHMVRPAAAANLPL